MTNPIAEAALVNPDEPHTGESASESGYVYRTLNLTTDWLRSALCEFGEAARRFKRYLGITPRQYRPNA